MYGDLDGVVNDGKVFVKLAERFRFKHEHDEILVCRQTTTKQFVDATAKGMNKLFRSEAQEMVFILMVVASHGMIHCGR